MSELNSISGLNKVSVDFRPEIKVVADSDDKKGGVEVVKSEAPRLRQEKGVASSVLRQLDVLLINAAKRSATANVAEKAKSVGQSLQLAGSIAPEKAAELVTLAKRASKTLAALDKYSGAQLAGALCDKGEDGYGFSTNPMGVMTAVASDVKAAIDAQTALSDALYKLTNGLSRADSLSDEQFDTLTELQLQCDRRATEINSIVCRMHVLAADDAVNGANADPGVKEMLKAKFLELMPREALMMHGTADALELMRTHLGQQVGALAERLDAFAADYGKDLTPEDIVKIQADMATMKAAVADVAKNGIRFKVNGNAGEEKEIKVDVDKSILKEMEGVLSGIEAKLATVRQQCAQNVRTAFLEGVRDKLLPKSVPQPAAEPDTPFGTYVGVVGRFMQLLEGSATGELSDEAIKNELTVIAYDIEAAHINPKLFTDLGYSPEQAREINGAIQSLQMLVDQYKALVRNTAAFANEGDDPMVTQGDIRRMLLGEVGVSSVVEARARGYKAEDVNPKADDSNIVDSKTLGAGQSNTCYLLTTKSGEKFVFKPELEARIGLNVMPLGTGAYRGDQSGANLSIATAEAAKMLGFEDMIVKYSVGTHNGRFGVFMELAEGYTGYALAVNPDGNSDQAAVNSLKAEVAQAKDENKVQGQIAQQLNRLQWLDIIIGQGDRHWENYYINIAKTTHDVKLKAIDNEVAFSEERIGVQKFRFSRRKASMLKRYLEHVCLAICGGDRDRARAQFQKCWKNSPALKIDAQRKEVTLDLFKIDRTNRELAIAYSGMTGAQTISFPDTIDEALYNKLIDLDTTPGLKDAFFAKLAPRLSGRALEAARARLDDAIAYARHLNDKKQVFTDEDWLNPAKRDSRGGIPRTVNVYDANGARITLDPNKKDLEAIKMPLERFLIGCCGNLYKRDYLHTAFVADKNAGK